MTKFWKKKQIPEKICKSCFDEDAIWSFIHKRDKQTRNATIEDCKEVIATSEGLTTKQKLENLDNLKK